MAYRSRKKGSKEAPTKRFEPPQAASKKKQAELVEEVLSLREEELSGDENAYLADTQERYEENEPLLRDIRAVSTSFEDFGSVEKSLSAQSKNTVEKKSVLPGLSRGKKKKKGKKINYEEDEAEGSKIINFAKKGYHKAKGKVVRKKEELTPVLKKPLQSQQEQMEQMIFSVLKGHKGAPYGRTKLMVVGEGRAGKTCTINALLNQKFNPEEASTKGFDVKRVDATQWEEDNGSYLVEHLQSVIGSNESSKGMPPKPPTERTNESKGQQEAKVNVSKEEIKFYGEALTLEKSGENPLSFSIWDFGGQQVFYTLHHLFLTEYGCYLLVFNPHQLLNEKQKKETIEYLKFWLFSKKIHAPTAPILLVATRCDDLNQEQTYKVNDILMQEVLKLDAFNEVKNDKFVFHPIDNKSSSGIINLREKIEKVVRAQSYIKEQVPVSFLRVLQLLNKEEKPYVDLTQVEQIMADCGLSEELFAVALDFLNQRGLVIFFSEPQVLRKLVILQPQWLINGLTDIFFDTNEHTEPNYDQSLNRDFRKFLFERIISKNLLNNIWDLKGYSKDVQEFFTGLMLKSSLMCDYAFDKEDSYLVPSLFSTGVEASEDPDDESDYTGPSVVIDFSGRYDTEMVQDNGDVYVRYLPLGVFERLVCLCVEHSATFKKSMTPKISNTSAQLSFGVQVDFEIKMSPDENGEMLWLKINTDESTTFEDAKYLIQIIYTMVEGLKNDFFGKTNSATKLAVSLLIPSSAESGSILADYRLIRREREQAAGNFGVKIRPSMVNKKKVHLKAYNAWFGTNDEDDVDILVDPNAEFSKKLEVDKSLRNVVTLNTKPLNSKLKYHCFLSYKQSSAIDMVGKQYFILSNKGYKCWYDMQFPGEINLENMQQGVRDSMCYILFLSKDIFPSYYVEQEVKMAISLNKPIILLHHPDTGNLGYWQFGDYIAKAPDVLKPLFAEVESIQLQRRFYLEQAVTEELDRRLTDIYSGLPKDS